MICSQGCTPHTCARFPESSTPRPTKRLRSPPTRCCPSSRPSRRHAGVVGRDPRHLARRPHPRQLSGAAAAEQRAAGRPRRARRARQDAGRQHHQAAEHQRLDPAAEGGDQGAAESGLRRARLSRRPADRRREGDQGAATPRCWAAPSTRSCAKGTPIAASRRRSSGTRRTHPHAMGAWSGDSKTHVAHMSGGDFYANEQSAVIAADGSLRIELTDVERAAHRAQGVGRRSPPATSSPHR